MFTFSTNKSYLACITNYYIGQYILAESMPNTWIMLFTCMQYVCAYILFFLYQYRTDWSSTNTEEQIPLLCQQLVSQLVCKINIKGWLIAVYSTTDLELFVQVVLFYRKSMYYNVLLYSGNTVQYVVMCNVRVLCYGAVCVI